MIYIYILLDELLLFRFHFFIFYFLHSSLPPSRFPCLIQTVRRPESAPPSTSAPPLKTHAVAWQATKPPEAGAKCTPD